TPICFIKKKFKMNGVLGRPIQSYLTSQSAAASVNARHKLSNSAWLIHLITAQPANAPSSEKGMNWRSMRKVSRVIMPLAIMNGTLKQLSTRKKHEQVPM